MRAVVQVPSQSIPDALGREHASDPYRKMALYRHGQRIALVNIKNSIASSEEVLDILRSIITMVHDPSPIPAQVVMIGNIEYNMPEMVRPCPYHHDNDFDGGVLREYQHTYLFFPTHGAWDTAVNHAEELTLVDVEVVYDMPPPPVME